MERGLGEHVVSSFAKHPGSEGPEAKGKQTQGKGFVQGFVTPFLNV